MRLSTKGRYAVMAMADLAGHEAVARAVSLAEVAERQGISLSYLEQLFAKLRRLRKGLQASSADMPCHVEDAATAGGDIAKPRASRSGGRTRSGDGSVPLTIRAFSLADKSCAPAS